MLRVEKGINQPAAQARDPENEEFPWSRGGLACLFAIIVDE